MINFENINYVNIIAIMIFVIFLILVIYSFFNKNNKYSYDIVDKYVNNLKKEKIKVQDYEIVKYYNVLSDKECELIINGSKNNLADSIVYKNNFTSKGIDPDIRISKTAWLSKDDASNDLRNVISKLEEITSYITNKPIVNQEKIQVVNYEKGGYYNPHYDACNSSSIDSKIAMNGPTGQRVYTFLVYLNDNIEGGSTYFPKIDKHIYPKKGMGILFRNIHENSSEHHELSQHTGTVIKKGEKWICNIWVHENNYKNKDSVNMCYCPNCTNKDCYNVARLKGEKVCTLKKCGNEKCPNFYLKRQDCLCPHCDNKYCNSKNRKECSKPNCMNPKCPKGQINIENSKKTD